MLCKPARRSRVFTIHPHISAMVYAIDDIDFHRRNVMNHLMLLHDVHRHLPDTDWGHPQRSYAEWHASCWTHDRTWMCEERADLQRDVSWRVARFRQVRATRIISDAVLAWCCRPVAGPTYQRTLDHWRDM